MGEKPEIGHGVDTVVAYINQTSTGRCSVLKMAMSYSLGLIAASMLLLGGGDGLRICPRYEGPFQSYRLLPDQYTTQVG